MDTILYMLIILLDFDHALSCIAREDPSIRVSYNEETGQVG